MNIVRTSPGEASAEEQEVRDLCQALLTGQHRPFFLGPVQVTSSPSSWHPVGLFQGWLRSRRAGCPPPFAASRPPRVAGQIAWAPIFVPTSSLAFCAGVVEARERISARTFGWECRLHVVDRHVVGWLAPGGEFKHVRGPRSPCYGRATGHRTALSDPEGTSLDTTPAGRGRRRTDWGARRRRRIMVARHADRPSVRLCGGTISVYRRRGLGRAPRVTTRHRCGDRDRPAPKGPAGRWKKRRKRAQPLVDHSMTIDIIDLFLRSP